jgi:hypothetical protein
MKFHRLFVCGIFVFVTIGTAAAQDTRQAKGQSLNGQSNEYIPSPPLIESSYPLANVAARK